MTRAQSATIAVCASGGMLTFTLNVTLSLPSAGVDAAAVWRGAAWILVLIFTIGVAATIVLARIDQVQRLPMVVYADKEALHQQGYPVGEDGMRARIAAIEDVLAGVVQHFPQADADPGDVGDSNVVKLPSQQTVRALENFARRIVRDAENGS